MGQWSVVYDSGGGGNQFESPKRYSFKNGDKTQEILLKS